jgi:hypothetical protein
MLIIVVGFVLSSFLMIGFIELHLAMVVLLIGIVVIYNLFSPAEFSSFVWYCLLLMLFF